MCNAVLAKVIQFYKLIPILTTFFLLLLGDAVDEIAFENIIMFL